MKKNKMFTIYSKLNSRICDKLSTKLIGAKKFSSTIRIYTEEDSGYKGDYEFTFDVYILGEHLSVDRIIIKKGVEGGTAGYWLTTADDFLTSQADRMIEKLMYMIEREMAETIVLEEKK